MYFGLEAQEAKRSKNAIARKICAIRAKRSMRSLYRPPPPLQDYGILSR